MKSQALILISLGFFMAFVWMTTIAPTLTALATESEVKTTGFATLAAALIGPVVIIITIVGYFAYRSLKEP